MRNLSDWWEVGPVGWKGGFSVPRPEVPGFLSHSAYLTGCLIVVNRTAKHRAALVAEESIDREQSAARSKSWWAVSAPSAWLNGPLALSWVDLRILRRSGRSASLKPAEHANDDDSSWNYRNRLVATAAASFHFELNYNRSISGGINSTKINSNPNMYQTTDAQQRSATSCFYIEKKEKIFNCLPFFRPADLSQAVTIAIIQKAY